MKIYGGFCFLFLIFLYLCNCLTIPNVRMNEDISNIEKTSRPSATLRPELQRTSEEPEKQQDLQMQQQAATAVQCPHCGATNDAEAMFCASCGKPLHATLCPHCGSEIDPDADYCEICHRYIRPEICSFCGAHIDEQVAYCPECGSPRGGIVCPVCRTLNNFAFCKQCGTALTDDAKLMVKQLQTNPDYQQLLKITSEYSSLEDMIPYTSERDLVRDQMNMQLRERVLRLLAEDRGETPPQSIEQKKRMTKEELVEQKAEKIKSLSAILDKLALPESASPVVARNFAMASKPTGVRLAWVCNYKHAMHSSPCGCAKPQLGGKWVILGKNMTAAIKDDNQ